MFYNICFSQLTDQMNDYMAAFQLLGRYLPQISNPDFDNAWQTTLAHTLHTAQFGLTPLTRKAFTTEPLRRIKEPLWRMSEPLQRKIERPLRRIIRPSCAIIDPPRRIIEWLILVNCWSRRRKTKVLSAKTWACSSSYEYWACLWDKQRFWEKSKG